MRVKIHPGTHAECEKELAEVMTPRDVFATGAPARVAVGNLINLLVERGVLTLEDCRALGAVHMEAAE